MQFQEIVSIIFDKTDHLENALDDLDKKIDFHAWILEYGMSTKRFLYLDYKGEEDYEIVNYILDYEFNHGIELASQEELEQLGEFEYEFLPDKIREVNEIISSKGYGLFSYPTTGDYYALFIEELVNKTKLLQFEILENENIPLSGKYIQYYN
ncbi:hypothetical protein CSE16_09115 [Solibacillus sp. R5-41]|uniref:DUF6630 family protein n=1 Tax=Solibacillus sp. R5-41 TaxID=2048654 RepID=UPI000C127806|nr:hypothetical protein [Solibacillus sp. R5-41]ATP40191.1 hypothetical protein CSE16_09115 [Solibacillus sp. R5-41]